jgi:transposase
MPNYKPYDYNQSSMVVINYQDQLQAGTFEHALHHLIDNKIDLRIFHPRYKNDDTGRPAYDPAILLKIILFAYSKGITSSREIQWCCETNIIFKALSCDSVPHFTTIAHFVSSHVKEIEDLFSQIVLICNEQGLIGNELFAIDGCKMSSNAAKEWSGTHKELKNKADKIFRQMQYHVAEHQRIDGNDTADEARRKRCEQAIETLNEGHKKIQQFLKTQEPRIGQGKQKKEVKSNITDNDSAKMTTSKGTIQGYNGVASVDKRHQIIIDAQAFGSGQEHHILEPVLKTIKARYKKLKLSNDIYEDNVIITADTGFANESNMKYLHERSINAYIPDNQFRSRDPKFVNQKSKYGKRHQKPKSQQSTKVIPGSDFSFDPVAQSCVCPSGETISFRGERTDQYGNKRATFEGRLSQCKVCDLKARCMKNPASANHRKGSGRQVSFALSAGRKPTHTDWMKHRVDSPKGKLVYSHRMSVVEPVFANIGTQKRLSRFSLRSREKVDSQWKLYCMVHNIEKISNYGSMAA